MPSFDRAEGRTLPQLPQQCAGASVPHGTRKVWCVCVVGALQFLLSASARHMHMDYYVEVHEAMHATHLPRATTR